MTSRRPLITPPVLLCLVGFATWAPAKETGVTPIAAARPALELQDGDTLVFLGDSITHQCLYTQYIENFFYTRYPERRIRFHNAGVSGDRAADALARFEEDVAVCRPDFVSVLLGMNDGEYKDFDRAIFGTYEAGMTEIIGRIEAAGATPILLTPTIFDHHQLAIAMEDPDYRFREKPFSRYYNPVLAFFGAWVGERAVEKGLPFVNLWAPLNDLTMDARRKQPDFTLVPDAIHPSPAGQFIMAFSFLSQLRPERLNVSSISFVRQGGRWKAGGESAAITAIEGDDTRLAFTFAARSLPWVVPETSTEADLKWKGEPGAMLGYEVTRAGHRLSNERLKVAGLAPGTYEILIDGRSIGKPVSHVQLGTKLELQANPRTPQHEQAMKVALLNRARNDEAMRPLRDLWAEVKGMRRKFGGEGEKFEEELAVIRPQIEAMQALAAEFEERIYASNRPVPRRYEIRKAK